MSGHITPAFINSEIDSWIAHDFNDDDALYIVSLVMSRINTFSSREEGGAPGNLAPAASPQGSNAPGNLPRNESSSQLAGSFPNNNCVGRAPSVGGSSRPASDTGAGSRHGSHPPFPPFSSGPPGCNFSPASLRESQEYLQCLLRMVHHRGNDHLLAYHCLLVVNAIQQQLKALSTMHAEVNGGVKGTSVIVRKDPPSSEREDDNNSPMGSVCVNKGEIGVSLETICRAIHLNMNFDVEDSTLGLIAGILMNNLSELQELEISSYTKLFDLFSALLKKEQSTPFLFDAALRSLQLCLRFVTSHDRHLLTSTNADNDNGGKNNDFIQLLFGCVARYVGQSTWTDVSKKVDEALGEEECASVEALPCLCMILESSQSSLFDCIGAVNLLRYFFWSKDVTSLGSSCTSLQVHRLATLLAAHACSLRWLSITKVESEFLDSSVPKGDDQQLQRIFVPSSTSSTKIAPKDFEKKNCSQLFRSLIGLLHVATESSRFGINIAEHGIIEELLELMLTVPSLASRAGKKFCPLHEKFHQNVDVQLRLLPFIHDENECRKAASSFVWTSVSPIRNGSGWIDVLTRTLRLIFSEDEEEEVKEGPIERQHLFQGTPVLQDSVRRFMLIEIESVLEEENLTESEARMALEDAFLPIFSKGNFKHVDQELAAIGAELLFTLLSILQDVPCEIFKGALDSIKKLVCKENQSVNSAKSVADRIAALLFREAQKEDAPNCKCILDFLMCLFLSSSMVQRLYAFSVLLLLHCRQGKVFVVLDPRTLSSLPREYSYASDDPRKPRPFSFLPPDLLDVTQITKLMEATFCHTLDYVDMILKLLFHFLSDETFGPMVDSSSLISILIEALPIACFAEPQDVSRATLFISVLRVSLCFASDADENPGSGCVGFSPMSSLVALIRTLAPHVSVFRPPAAVCMLDFLSSIMPLITRPPYAAWIGVLANCAHWIPDNDALQAQTLRFLLSAGTSRLLAGINEEDPSDGSAILVEIVKRCLHHLEDQPGASEFFLAHQVLLAWLSAATSEQRHSVIQTVLLPKVEHIGTPTRRSSKSAMQLASSTSSDKSRTMAEEIPVAEMRESLLDYAWRLTYVHTTDYFPPISDDIVCTFTGGVSRSWKLNNRLITFTLGCHQQILMTCRTPTSVICMFVSMLNAVSSRPSLPAPSASTLHFPSPNDCNEMSATEGATQHGVETRKCDSCTSSLPIHFVDHCTECNENYCGPCWAAQHVHVARRSHPRPVKSAIPKPFSPVISEPASHSSAVVPTTGSPVERGAPDLSSSSQKSTIIRTPSAVRPTGSSQFPRNSSGANLDAIAGVSVSSHPASRPPTAPPQEEAEKSVTGLSISNNNISAQTSSTGNVGALASNPLQVTPPVPTPVRPSGSSAATSGPTASNNAPATTSTTSSAAPGVRAGNTTPTSASGPGGGAKLGNVASYSAAALQKAVSLIKRHKPGKLNTSESVSSIDNVDIASPSRQVQQTVTRQGSHLQGLPTTADASPTSNGVSSQPPSRAPSAVQVDTPNRSRYPAAEELNDHTARMLISLLTEAPSLHAFFEPQDFRQSIPATSSYFRNLRVLDRIPCVENFKIGVSFLPHAACDLPHSCSETDLLSCSRPSKAFMDTFFTICERRSLLVPRIVLENPGMEEGWWPNGAPFTGGLPYSNSEEQLSNCEHGGIYYTHHTPFSKAVFHIAPFMPNLRKDPSFLKKKRHLGNDPVLIIFTASPIKFPYKALITAFKSEVTEVFIVVETMHATLFRVSVHTSTKASNIVQRTSANASHLISKDALPHTLLNLSQFYSVLHKAAVYERDGVAPNWVLRAEALRKLGSIREGGN